MSDPRSSYCADCGSYQCTSAADCEENQRKNAALPAPAATPAAQVAEPVPIDMVLHCPKCGKQHIDMPEMVEIERPGGPPGNQMLWDNPPHRSHLCRPDDGGCGHIWRPADVPTNGVEAVKTKGKADSPIAYEGSST